MIAPPEFLLEAAQGWARLYADRKLVSTGGTYTSGRATRNMDRFPVRHSGDTVVVDVSRLIQSDTNKAQWDAAAIQL